LRGRDGERLGCAPSGKHGFEKLVAIKTILPRFAGDERFREMFLDEARIASRIEHPNVVRSSISARSTTCSF